MSYSYSEHLQSLKLKIFQSATSNLRFSGTRNLSYTPETASTFILKLQWTCYEVLEVHIKYGHVLPLNVIFRCKLCLLLFHLVGEDQKLWKACSNKFSLTETSDYIKNKGFFFLKNILQTTCFGFSAKKHSSKCAFILWFWSAPEIQQTFKNHGMLVHKQYSWLNFDIPVTTATAFTWCIANYTWLPLKCRIETEVKLDPEKNMRYTSFSEVLYFLLSL